VKKNCNNLRLSLCDATNYLSFAAQITFFANFIREKNSIAYLQ